MMLQNRYWQMGTWTTAIVLSFSALLSGCNSNLNPDYEKLGLVEISGTVKLDGEPLPETTVRFEESPFLYSYGVTDSQGNYRLMLDSRKSGIVPGEKTVRFLAGKPPSEGGQGKKGDEGDPDEKPKSPSPTRLPEVYNTKPMIKVVVTNSDSHFDFDLKSDGSTRARQ